MDASLGEDISMTTMIPSRSLGSEEHIPSSTSPRWDLLWSIFAALDVERISWCLFRSYQARPISADKDVDLVVPTGTMVNEVAPALKRVVERLGAQIVSWKLSESQLLVAVSRGNPPVFVKLDIVTSLRRNGRTFYSDREALSSRRREQCWWLPPQPVEFGFHLVEKTIKRTLAAGDGERLTEMYRSDPDACGAQIDRFWGEACARLLREAAGSGDWEEVLGRIEPLRGDVLRRNSSPSARSWQIDRLRTKIEQVASRLRAGGGLYVAFLGPDGAGKSTAIDAIAHDLAGLLDGRVTQDEFNPALPGRVKKSATGSSRPHESPPRTGWQGWFKGIWWCLRSSAGFYFTTAPKLVRSAVLLQHRCFLDGVVDPLRYRYGGPPWLAELAWRLARKPDILILLTASPEVIHARKQEVTPEETARQSRAYLQRVELLPYGFVVDAARQIEETVGNIEEIILGELARRAVSR